ncbi:MAG TPA: YjbQ family protein [Actinomycetota bacterium]|nr:YjbQ family protein [Actinomycetota bacterium]
MKTARLKLETGNSRALVDLTHEVRKFVQDEGDGLVNISIPHATAGLILMELGSGSDEDLWDRLHELLPRNIRYVHSHGSPGHGADHVLPAFISPTLTLPVIDGEVSLGIWQSIVLIDPNVDNPRREVLLAFLAG